MLIDITKFLWQFMQQHQVHVVFMLLSCHVMSCHCVVSCRVMPLLRVMSCYVAVVSFRVVSICDIQSCRVVSPCHFIMSCHGVWSLTVLFFSSSNHNHNNNKQLVARTLVFLLQFRFVLCPSQQAWVLS